MKSTYELKLAVTFHCDEEDVGKVRRALQAHCDAGTLATVLREELGADDVQVDWLKVFEHGDVEDCKEA
jgi:hypothetical protein